MGQYQQWLRYQDVERSLRKTRQALEEELAQLEVQLDTLFFEQLALRELPLHDNPILSALLTAFDASQGYVAEQSFVADTLALASAWEYHHQHENEPTPEDVIFLNRLHTVFTALRPEEVEQFYTAYKQCLLQGRVTDVRLRLTGLLEQLDVNAQRTQDYQPSPIALASLARLQANGVSDSELLDQMLERGESWLDLTMQRLDYCERLENFLSDDYTQWCYRALDGAFDWMDPLRDESMSPSADVEVAEVHQEEEPAPGAAETEVILLQKLTTESDDDEPNGLDASEIIEEGATHQPDKPGQADHTAEIESNASDEEAQLEQEAPFAAAASPKKPGAMRRLVGRLWGE